MPALARTLTLTPTPTTTTTLTLTLTLTLPLPSSRQGVPALSAAAADTADDYGGDGAPPSHRAIGSRPPARAGAGGAAWLREQAAALQREGDLTLPKHSLNPDLTLTLTRS